MPAHTITSIDFLFATVTVLVLVTFAAAVFLLARVQRPAMRPTGTAPDPVVVGSPVASAPDGTSRSPAAAAA